MFSHKLHFSRYITNIAYYPAQANYFKNREKKIEGGWIYFNLIDKDFYFLSDWGLENVVEENI